MNELLVFLGNISDAGWVYLCVLFALAMGFFLFDRRAKVSAAQDVTSAKERRAA